MCDVGKGFLMLGPLCILMKMDNECSVLDENGNDIGKLHVSIEIVSINGNDVTNEIEDESTHIVKELDGSNVQIKITVHKLTNSFITKVTGVTIATESISPASSPTAIKPSTSDKTEVLFGVSTEFTCIPATQLQQLLGSAVLEFRVQGEYQCALAVAKKSNVCIVM